MFVCHSAPQVWNRSITKSTGAGRVVAQCVAEAVVAMAGYVALTPAFGPHVFSMRWYNAAPVWTK